MKIVDRATFLAMPKGTVFIHESIDWDQTVMTVGIKGDTIDSIYCHSTELFAKQGWDVHHDMRFPQEKLRTLPFSNEDVDLYALSPDDVRALINRLETALKESNENS